LYGPTWLSHNGEAERLGDALAPELSKQNGGRLGDRLVRGLDALRQPAATARRFASTRCSATRASRSATEAIGEQRSRAAGRAALDDAHAAREP
jgi:hypothetical protein